MKTSKAWSLNCVMTDNRIKKILILGGGSAGWMTAAALSKLLGNNYCDIEVVESDEIGTVGVGEATIPQIQLFNRLLGLDEDEFIRRTQGTFKLGIEFVNWNKLGNSYIHAFGDVGRDMEGIEFYQYWLRMCAEGQMSGLAEYTLTAQACYRKKFMRPVDAGNSPLSNIAYAFHFDAALYAKLLRELAEVNGVARTEGKVTKTVLREDGFIQELVLDSGQRKKADLFIDCSGFKGVLIEEALKTGYEDWTHWLPCDRAVAVPCESLGEPLPYTRATAHAAGWQWRIPLQHRIGNGHVFSSRFMTEDEATDILLRSLGGRQLADPRVLKFTTGKRKLFWNKNCVAIGLASGFMEPLESTSLHLVQSAIARLLTFFPDKGFAQQDIDAYNRQSHFEFDKIRDFLILHYHATQRDDSAFWRYCRNMPVPESLTRKIELFKRHGRVVRDADELFSDMSWVEVMHGQGIEPAAYHPLVDVMPKQEIAHRLASIKAVIDRSVDRMPSHAQFIKEHCKAPSV
jgi:tryptophan halogenase